jgi:leucyl aminopeptidase (aminopeptidase T)
MNLMKSMRRRRAEREGTHEPRPESANSERECRGLCIDWMIGSDKTDIDGIHADGRRVPVFRNGEWA